MAAQLIIGLAPYPAVGSLSKKLTRGASGKWVVVLRLTARARRRRATTDGAFPSGKRVGRHHPHRP